MLNCLLNPIQLPSHESLKGFEGKGNYAISKYYKFPYRPFYRKKLYMVRELLDKKRVYKNILDFGSGPGIFTKELNKHSTSVNNVDKDDLIDKRSRYECIVCASSLEFIDDLPGVISKLSYITSYSGQIIVASPLQNLLTKSYFKMVGDDLVRNSPEVIKYLVERFYKVVEYREWMGLYFCMKGIKN